MPGDATSVRQQVIDLLAMNQDLQALQPVLLVLANAMDRARVDQAVAMSEMRSELRWVRGLVFTLLIAILGLIVAILR